MQEENSCGEYSKRKDTFKNGPFERYKGDKISYQP